MLDAERRRKSQGAAWYRNGQAKRLGALDEPMTALVSTHHAICVDCRGSSGKKVVIRRVRNGQVVDLCATCASQPFSTTESGEMSNPKEIGALRFLLPAGEQASASIGDRWGAEFHVWEPDDLTWRMHAALILFKSYEKLEATRPPYSVIEKRALGIAAMLGLADEQIPSKDPDQGKPSNHQINSAADVERLFGKPDDQKPTSQKQRVLDLAAALVEAVRYAGAHPETPEAFEMPKGFKLEERGKKTVLVHPDVPDKAVVVAFKGNFDLKFDAMWQVTRNEIAELCWAVERAPKSAKLAAAESAPMTTGITRVYIEGDNLMRELLFSRWGDDGLHIVNELGEPAVISWGQLAFQIHTRTLRIEGDMPEKVRKIVPSTDTRKRYERDTRLFIGSHSGGGGFIPFGGEFRNWYWVQRNCVCAECGCGIGVRKSNEQADGLNRGARYFTCNGVQRHVIRRESDLRWMSGAENRDKKRRLKVTVDEVLDAYPWLTATVPDAEEIPY